MGRVRLDKKWCVAGLVTGITGSVLVLFLCLKVLRRQGTMQSSEAALVIATHDMGDF